MLMRTRQQTSESASDYNSKFVNDVLEELVDAANIQMNMS
jgi:hypothetical protein